MVISDDNLKRKQKDSFGVSVFNEDMILEWERKVKLPYMEKELSIQD
ncbi:MAG: hypothetical protein ACJAWV_000149 [Flammeovirgaceae bacterium]|jgi:hypothetical protein